MGDKKNNNSRHFSKLRLFLLLLSVNFYQNIFAHQSPSTIVLLDINPKSVSVELQMPLGELELAFGHQITKDPGNLIKNFGPQLKEYLLAHIHPMSAKDLPWEVEVIGMELGEAEQTASGPYQEIIVNLRLTPPPDQSTREFIFDYDVIMHQLVTHSALVSIRNDWEMGKTDNQALQVGVIRVDTRTTLIYPLRVSLDQKGSFWKGFKGMFNLGMEHIYEGTDHLLFLFVLLLPAPLLVNKRQWGSFGGTKYSVYRLLKIITAFTIGHSITLLAGALGWAVLAVKPIEILIAVSILVSAFHAVYPIFPNKEVYIAAGFGLIHGLAFASIILLLHLDNSAMVVSILGFNLGIEAMQLLIVLAVVPWLILLSRTPVYKQFRITMAVLSGIAAIGWVFERIYEKPNSITILINDNYKYAPWVLGLLILFSIVSFLAFVFSSEKKT